MRLKSPKQKGSNFERDCARDVKRLSGDALEAFRVPLSGAVDGFKGDLRYVVRDPTWQPWADIIPECKCQEKLNIWKAIGQAIGSAGRHKWMLLFKRNRTETFVVMSLVDLMNLFVETVEDVKE